jgi:hypothetical protein
MEGSKVIPPQDQLRGQESAHEGGEQRDPKVEESDLGECGVVPTQERGIPCECTTVFTSKTAGESQEQPRDEKGNMAVLAAGPHKIRTHTL